MLNYTAAPQPAAAATLTQCNSVRKDCVCQLLESEAALHCSPSPGGGGGQYKSSIEPWQVITVLRVRVLQQPSPFPKNLLVVQAAAQIDETLPQGSSSHTADREREELLMGTGTFVKSKWIQ